MPRTGKAMSFKDPRIAGGKGRSANRQGVDIEAGGRDEQLVRWFFLGRREGKLKQARDGKCRGKETKKDRSSVYVTTAGNRLHSNVEREYVRKRVEEGAI